MNKKLRKARLRQNTRVTTTNESPITRTFSNSVLPAETKENIRANAQKLIPKQYVRFHFANSCSNTPYVQIIPTSVKGAKPNWLDKCNAIISEIIIALGRIIRRYQ